VTGDGGGNPGKFRLDSDISASALLGGSASGG